MTKTLYEDTRLFNFTIKLNINYNKDKALNLACANHIDDLLHHDKYTLQSEQHDLISSLLRKLTK